MENLNFDNRIHEQNGLYCLNDIAEKLIGSTNIKEYMKKIPNKEYINGNCYITKDHMIEILLKSKAELAKKYLEYLKKKDNIKLENNVTKEKDASKHITTTQEIQSKTDNRKFIDNGSNEIIYNNKRILFFEYNKMLYFRGKDACDLLEYTNSNDIIKKHVDKEDIFLFDLYLGNEGNKRDVANGDGRHSPINISKVIKKNNTVISNINEGIEVSPSAILGIPPDIPKNSTKDNIIISNIDKNERYSQRLYRSSSTNTSKNINISDNKISDINEGVWAIKTIAHTPHLQLESNLNLELEYINSDNNNILFSKVIEGEVSRHLLLTSPHLNKSKNINIEEIKKLKTNIEKKINKYIDPKTIFINESGLYSLILSSKMPEAKRFKHWVTNDVLVSIRKYGSFNTLQNAPVYDEKSLKSLENTPTVYIIHVGDSLYKFGQSMHLTERMNNHKSTLKYEQIIKIYEFPFFDYAINVENKIKKYTTNNKIRKIIDEGIEFFETNTEFTLEKVIKEINRIVEDEMSVHENQIKNIKLETMTEIDNRRLNEYNKIYNIELERRKIEQEKTKQIQEKNKEKELEIRKDELEIRKQELEVRKQELEILKLKQQPIQQQPIQQQPIQPQPIQPQIQININNIPNNNNDNNNRHKTKKCQDCNKKIFHQSVRCNNCTAKFRIITSVRESNRPSLEQLELDLRDSSFVQVGKKYGVSDNCIRKWIKNYRKIVI
jgi:prophage antirepressor-like protein